MIKNLADRERQVKAAIQKATDPALTLELEVQLGTIQAERAHIYGSTYEVRKKEHDMTVNTSMPQDEYDGTPAGTQTAVKKLWEGIHIAKEGRRIIMANVKNGKKTPDELMRYDRFSKDIENAKDELKTYEELGKLGANAINVNFEPRRAIPLTSTQQVERTRVGPLIAHPPNAIDMMAHSPSHVPIGTSTSTSTSASTSTPFVAKPSTRAIDFPPLPPSTGSVIPHTQHDPMSARADSVVEHFNKQGIPYTVILCMARGLSIGYKTLLDNVARTYVGLMQGYNHIHVWFLVLFIAHCSKTRAPQDVFKGLSEANLELIFDDGVARVKRGGSRPEQHLGSPYIYHDDHFERSDRIFTAIAGAMATSQHVDIHFNWSFTEQTIVNPIKDKQSYEFPQLQSLFSNYAIPYTVVLAMGPDLDLGWALLHDSIRVEYLGLRLMNKPLNVVFFLMYVFYIKEGGAFLSRHLKRFSSRAKRLELNSVGGVAQIHEAAMDTQELCISPKAHFVNMYKCFDDITRAMRNKTKQVTLEAQWTFAQLENPSTIPMSMQSRSHVHDQTLSQAQEHTQSQVHEQVGLAQA